jgi:hypothetical protein
MSKLKLRLIGLAFIGLSLLPLGARTASACIDLVVWATNPKTGECREFGTPCQVPQGWIINHTGCPTTS